MIRIAEITDINSILDITKSCALRMNENKIFQWNDQYPNEEAFINDVKNNELYVYVKNKNIVGCISLCNNMDDVYKTVCWNTKNKNNLYVHRLAVHPNFQRQGVGKLLMDFGENYAKKNSYISIRLDTFSKNKRNLKFYESRGYNRLDRIFFPKQSEFPFYCYELIL